METTDIKAQKSALRRAISSSLRLLPPSTRGSFSQRICANLELWLSRNSQVQERLVAAYLATPAETNVDAFIRHLQVISCSVVVPRGDAETEMPLYSLWSWAEIERGPFGTREPKLNPDCAPSSPAAVGIWLVPGVAFDEQGYRLGRGGGWYDRVLSRAAPDAVKIGVCFECQIVAQVPHESHDVRLDCVMTEARTLDTCFPLPASSPYVSTDAE